MSIIVWDPKNKIVAADRLMTSDAGRKGTHIKLGLTQASDWRVGFGAHTMVFGCAGRCATERVLLDWVLSGSIPSSFPLTIDPNRVIYATVVLIGGTNWVQDFDDNQPHPTVYKPEEPNAWGSGAPYALGAMAAGADGIEAVAHATKFNCYCGAGWDAYTWKDGVWLWSFKEGEL